MKVKFYGLNDVATFVGVKDAIRFIEEYNFDVEHDVNEILCIENCLRYVDAGVRPGGLSEEEWANVVNKVSNIRGAVGSFWNSVSSDDVASMSGIDVEYHDDFLQDFVRYGLMNKVKKEDFWKAVEANHIWLREILGNKEMVKWLNDDIRAKLMIDKPGIELLINAKLVRSDGSELFLPLAITKSDIEDAARKYLEFDEVDVSLVELIAESSVGMGISDKTRLKAKRRHKVLVEEYLKEAGSLKYGVSARIIKGQGSPVEANYENGVVNVTFDEDVFLESLKDEEKMFAVLKSMFGIMRKDAITLLPAYKSELGLSDRFLGLKGKEHYEAGIGFQAKDQQAMSGLIAYLDFLRRHGKDVEEVVKWFFNSYLEKEYGVEGFHYSLSTSKTYYEKTKNVLTEMDGIARQFKLYVENGAIDPELLEISSMPVCYGDLKSLVSNKYCYLNYKNDDANYVLHALFSDQSHLNYINEDKCGENLFKMLADLDIRYSDFSAYQRRPIDRLIELGFLHMRDDGVVEVTVWAWLFSLINQVEAISYYARNRKIREELDVLVDKGWLAIGDTLLTRPEAEYFDFILNRKRYVDGLDLRNKYVHGSKSYAGDDEKHYLSYVRAIILMIVLMAKIDNDFLFADL